MRLRLRLWADGCINVTLESLKLAITASPSCRFASSGADEGAWEAKLWLGNGCCMGAGGWR